MEATKFNGESYSLGFLDGMYAITKQISKDHAERYLQLCEQTGQLGDSNVIEYIIDNYDL